jgi:hypothetical protein
LKIGAALKKVMVESLGGGLNLLAADTWTMRMIIQLLPRGRLNVKNLS